VSTNTRLSAIQETNIATAPGLNSIRKLFVPGDFDTAKLLKNGIDNLKTSTAVPVQK
jgi:hypothetical protein